MLILAIIIFILILSVLVIVHEAGHFWIARRNGVKVEEFGIGYPPRFCGWYKSIKTGKWRFFKGNNCDKRSDIKNTMYSINFIPFGGFVRLLGQESDSNSKESYSQKSPWTRAKIIFAGAGMNFLLALLLLTIWFWIVPKNLPNEIVVVAVEKNSVAESIGIKPNDFITKINNQTISSYEQLQEFTKANAGKEINITIKHYGKEETNQVVLPENSTAPLGVSLAETGMDSIPNIPWYQAPYYAFIEIVNVIWLSISYIGSFIASLFGGVKVSTDSVSGPIGIFTYLRQIIYLGPSFVIRFAAMISVAVGFTNLLPFPALDGGHLVFIAGEMIRGKKIMKEKWENAIHTIGFALLLILFVFVTYNDISRLIK